MDKAEEIALLKAVLSGEHLHIDSAAIVALQNPEGVSQIFVSMARDDGSKYCVPLGPKLALRIGEQLVRAADAIDAGLNRMPE